MRRRGREESEGEKGRETIKQRNVENSRNMNKDK